MKTWQLQTAKAQLSEVVKHALVQGPQEITLHGEPTVVVISKKDFDRLTRPSLSFIEFIRKSPLYGRKIKLQRDKSFTRDTNLFEDNE